jgi:hypothetical protein
VIHEKEFAAEMVRNVSPAPSTEPKPRVRLGDPVTYQCGWCGKYDVAENLRTNVLTGNAWPIHPHCVIDWYDGGDVSGDKL